MKKLSCILIAGLFFMTAINVIPGNAGSSEPSTISYETLIFQEQNVENEKIKIAFSALAVEDEGQYMTINIKEANGLLIKEGKPLLPMYTQQIVLPFGTKVTSVTA